MVKIKNMIAKIQEKNNNTKISFRLRVNVFITCLSSYYGIRVGEEDKYLRDEGHLTSACNGGREASLRQA